ncbi:hypothetical protein Tco_0801029 [Tanacetum coccineum]|uniref:Uncharacterized protein n=1 Tax=Tanacetum coccineum TaxID=301880 RepID=A0ABQ4ZX56_9ASTR
MDENPEFEMDNAVWTPTEAGTQAQGMDLVRERGQRQAEESVSTTTREDEVIVESQGSLRDRTGVFGCLLELSVTPPGAKAVEGKSVKIDYRVEDGISAIESLKFPPVGSSKYGFEVNFPYSIFFRYRSKDRDVPEVVSRKVSSVYAKAEEELESQSSVHRWLDRLDILSALVSPGGDMGVSLKNESVVLSHSFSTYISMGMSD